MKLRVVKADRNVVRRFVHGPKPHGAPTRWQKRLERIERFIFREERMAEWSAACGVVLSAMWKAAKNRIEIGKMYREPCTICPVCDGRGKLHYKFHHETEGGCEWREDCSECDGTGLVGEKEGG